MNPLLAFTIVLNALLVWQNCLGAEVTRHDVDVCVYGGTASGGTASGVMAALAAEKEGAKVILIEPRSSSSSPVAGSAAGWPGLD